MKHLACFICVHSNSVKDGFKVGRVHVLFIFVPSMSSWGQSSLLLYNNESPKHHHFIKNLITNTLFQCVWLGDGELEIYDSKGIFFHMDFTNKGVTNLFYKF